MQRRRTKITPKKMEKSTVSLNRGQQEKARPLARAHYRTFFGAPLCDNLDELQADVAFLGVPFDQGTLGRPGARLGPDGIRSTKVYSYWGYPYGNVEEEQAASGFWDVDAQAELLKGVTMADCGDIDVVPSDVVSNFDKITRAVEKMLRRGAFPVVVGGDHAITFPVVRALGKFAPLDIVHFDAHLDYTQDVQGAIYTHASPIRRSRELPFVRNVTSIGTRRTQRQVYEDAIRDGSLIITTQKLRELGPRVVADMVPPSENLYLTIDIDILDPSQAPGTGTPETGGLFYYEMREALIALLRKHKLVAFDVVEVAPPYDWADITTQVAAKLIIDILSQAFP